MLSVSIMIPEEIFAIIIVLYFISNVRLRQVLEMVTEERCPLTHQMKNLKGQLCSKL